jgi:uncharacterized protein (DUF58 family)
MPAARLSVAHALASDRTIEGERVSAAITVATATELPALELLYRLPAGLAAEGDGARVVLGLGAGESIEGRVDVACLARGRYKVGEIHLRLWHPSRLRVAEARIDDPKRLAVYPAAMPLRHLPRPLRTRSSFGNHVAARLGQGLEPGDLRPYAPGDRLRQINWRASLRTGRLYVTRFHEERNADVVLLLDTTADVGVRPGSSLDHCVRAAATLAVGYLRHRDRVGLIAYGGNVQWIRPAAGRRQIEVLLEALLPTSMTGNHSFQGLDILPPRVLPAGALVIALSPLIDPRFIRIVTNLAERGFDVLLLAISPLALMRQARTPSAVDALAGRMWSLGREASLEALRERGIAAVELRPDEPLDGVLAALAPGRRRRAAAP